MKKYVFTTALAVASILFLPVDKTFRKQHDIQSFSISLSVKDIAASKDFYEKLGFKPIEGAGSIAQKWMVLQNGKAKIGLFQGMFPKNTITINPKDARSIYKEVNQKGLKPVYTTGLDKAEGPASFALVDPDGNPVLIDQHK